MKSHSGWLPPALVLAVLATFPTASRAAEGYDSCVGFIQSLPAVISTQGTWCLDADLSTAMTSGQAITIAANNVTIDCNGFKIGGLAAGPGSTTRGIFSSGRLNSTVRNCGIRGFFEGVSHSGIAVSGHLVEDNRFDGILLIAILIDGDQSLVQRNRIFDTGGGTNAAGIMTRGDVIENTVDGVTGSTNGIGIQLNGDGSVARGNRLRRITAGFAAVAIEVNGEHAVVTENQVINAPASSGFGIAGDADTFCSRNTVAGFTNAAITGCIDAGGNATD